MKKEPGFRVQRRFAGFWITFENGITVGVQFGYGNYCENQYNKAVRGWLMNGLMGETAPEIVQSKDAEIAIIGRRGELLTKFFKGDSVLGWQTPKDFIEALQWASELTDEKILALKKRKI